MAGSGTGAAVSGLTALVLLGALPPPTGGVATHVALLSANLRAHGCDVAIVRPGQGVPGRVAAVTRVGRGWALLPELMLSLQRGTLLHGHSNPHLPSKHEAAWRIHEAGRIP